jgi:hypothetical protein
MKRQANERIREDRCIFKVRGIILKYKPGVEGGH